MKPNLSPPTYRDRDMSSCSTSFKNITLTLKGACRYPFHTRRVSEMDHALDAFSYRYPYFECVITAPLDSQSHA